MRVTQANLWEGKAFLWLKFLLVLVWGIAVNEYRRYGKCSGVRDGD